MGDSYTRSYITTHRFKQLKEIDVLTRRAKDPSITSVFECSHANKTGCPCKFVLREDQTGEIVGEHTQDTMHLNDIYSWRLFKAKQLILDDLINDPFISPHNILDKVFNSPDFVIDQFTPSKASLQNAIARLKAKIFGTLKIDLTTLSDYLQTVTTSSGELSLFVTKTTLMTINRLKELSCSRARSSSTSRGVGLERSWAMAPSIRSRQCSRSCTQFTHCTETRHSQSPLHSWKRKRHVLMKLCFVLSRTVVLPFTCS